MLSSGATSLHRDHLTVLYATKSAIVFPPSGIIRYKTFDIGLKIDLKGMKPKRNVDPWKSQAGM